MRCNSIQQSSVSCMYLRRFSHRSTWARSTPWQYLLAPTVEIAIAESSSSALTSSTPAPTSVYTSFMSLWLWNWNYIAGFTPPPFHNAFTLSICCCSLSSSVAAVEMARMSSRKRTTSLSSSNPIVNCVPHYESVLLTLFSPYNFPTTADTFAWCYSFILGLASAWRIGMSCRHVYTLSRSNGTAVLFVNLPLTCFINAVYRYTVSRMYEMSSWSKVILRVVSVNSSHYFIPVHSLTFKLISFSISTIVSTVVSSAPIANWNVRSYFSRADNVYASACNCVMYSITYVT